MEKYQVVCPRHSLYVVNAEPETNTLLLSSDPKKACAAFKVDADLYRCFAQDATGLEFILQDC
jgi:hypothetical protein